MTWVGERGVFHHVFLTVTVNTFERLCSSCLTYFTYLRYYAAHSSVVTVTVTVSSLFTVISGCSATTRKFKPGSGRVRCSGTPRDVRMKVEGVVSRAHPISKENLN